MRLTDEILERLRASKKLPEGVHVEREVHNGKIIVAAIWSGRFDGTWRYSLSHGQKAWNWWPTPEEAAEALGVEL